MATRSAWVITVSDRCAAGEAEDRSGPAVAARLSGAGFALAGTTLVADEVEKIASAIRAATAELVVTTRGDRPRRP